MSLGYRTDLALLRLGGAHVEDRGNHLVVRSLHNPTHWWGNFFVLAEIPSADTARTWLDLFAAEFPGAEHVAIGFDGIAGTVEDLDWFAQRGFTMEADVLVTATAVHQPRRVNADAI